MVTYISEVSRAYFHVFVGTQSFLFKKINGLHQDYFSILWIEKLRLVRKVFENKSEIRSPAESKRLRI
jgi:hypothetical protein